MATPSAAKANNSPAPTAKGARPAADANRPQPPAEEFWHRYSPHFEAPISGTSSVFFHLLCLFAMLVVGWGWLSFGGAHNIEFQTVKLPGGGGGNPNGVGNAPGVGTGAQEDVNGPDADQAVTSLPETTPLTADEVREARKVFTDEDSQRFISNNNENIAKAARNLSHDFLDKVRDGLTPGKGAGGPGSGGGQGTGRGTGDGAGIGSGKGTLSDREKRMLRWVMVFETSNGGDYVRQLAGLGAILAIPVSRDHYQVIEDLNARPAKPVEKDIASLNRIYWVDDKPQSVRGVLAELRLPNRANHFVAFMPQELEKKLGDMELAYKGLREDEIDETKFKVFRAGGGYDVKVVSQTKK